MIDQVRERKLKDIEQKAAKERERLEIMKLQQIARQQAAMSNGQGGGAINLVTDEMLKRVKVE